jgi:hypothetical protein
VIPLCPFDFLSVDDVTTSRSELSMSVAASFGEGGARAK